MKGIAPELDLALVAPNTAPLLTMILKANGRKSVDDPDLSWNEDGAKKKSYTQIFRTIVRPVQFSEKLIQHKMAIGRALLFGRAAAVEPFARFTQGVIPSIMSNRFDAGSVLTKEKWDEFVEACFHEGPAVRALIVAPSIEDYVLKWARHGEPTSHGITTRRVQPGHGLTWIMACDEALSTPAGDMAVSVEVGKIEYCAIRDVEVNHDIDPSSIVVKDEILTECGFRVRQERRHGLLCVEMSGVGSCEGIFGDSRGDDATH